MWRLLKEQLDRFNIAEHLLGSGWPSKTIICFVILLIVYAYSMNKLDKEHGYEEENNDKRPEFIFIGITFGVYITSQSGQLHLLRNTTASGSVSPFANGMATADWMSADLSMAGGICRRMQGHRKFLMG